MAWYSGRIREPLLEGESVTLLGQEFVVAPSNIARMRRTADARQVLREVQEKRAAIDSDAAIGALAEIAAVALSANYPDINSKVLENQEGLTPADLANLMEALRKANGNETSGEARAPEGGATARPTSGTT